MASQPNYFTKEATGYRCCVCLSLYEGAFAKQDSTQCCKKDKPYSTHTVRQAELIVNSYATKEVKDRTLSTLNKERDPGEGILYQDRWGHWRRGKVRLYGQASQPQVFAEYHKAREQLHKEVQRGIIAQLQSTFGKAVQLAFGDDWNPPTRRSSPSQKAAYKALHPKPFASGGSLIAARIAVARVDDQKIDLFSPQAQLSPQAPLPVVPPPLAQPCPQAWLLGPGALIVKAAINALGGKASITELHLFTDEFNAIGQEAFYVKHFQGAHQ